MPSTWVVSSFPASRSKFRLAQLLTITTYAKVRYVELAREDESLVSRRPENAVGMVVGLLQEPLKELFLADRFCSRSMQ